MATGSVPITAGTGTPIRIVNNAGVDGGADQQVVSLADSAGNLIGTAAAPVPTSLPDTVVTGTITTNDIAGPNPGSTSGTPVSTTPTVGSVVTAALSSGASSWVATLTGTFGGNGVYFEASYDGGSNWVLTEGRQSGNANQNYWYDSTVPGVFRGNISGATHFRLRAYNGGAATIAVTIRLSPTTGPVLLSSPINLPLLTKNSQIPTGSSTQLGIPTQDLKDAGRTAIALSATAVASVTTAALFTLNIWKAGVVTSATSYTVTSGKTFRLQGIQFGSRFATPSTTVTFASSRFDVRAISSGTLSATSNLLFGDSKMAASNVATPNSDLSIPDGFELPSGYVFGVSHVDSAATLLLDLLIVGYEY